MKPLILLLLIISPCAHTSELFFNVRNGLIVRESETFIVDNQKFDADYGSPWRVNVSFGYKMKNCFFFDYCKVGLSHESSPTRGKPLNQKEEYTNEQLILEVEYTVPVRFGR